MRLYKINAEYLHDDNTKVFVTQFVGSKADGVAERKKLMDDGARRKDITETEVDVPTDKTGLINWLNANAA